MAKPSVMKMDTQNVIDLIIEALGYVSWTDNFKRDEIMGKLKQAQEESVNMQRLGKAIEGGYSAKMQPAPKHKLPSPP